MNKDTDIDPSTDSEPVSSPDPESVHSPGREVRTADSQPTLTDWDRRQPSPQPPDGSAAQPSAPPSEPAPTGQNDGSADAPRERFSAEFPQHGPQAGSVGESPPRGQTGDASQSAAQRTAPETTQYAYSDGSATGQQYSGQPVDPLDKTWFNYALFGAVGYIGGVLIVLTASELVGLLVAVAGLLLASYAIYRDVSSLEAAGVWPSLSAMAFVALIGAGVILVGVFSLIPFGYYVYVRQKLTKQIALDQSVPRPMT